MGASVRFTYQELVNVPRELRTVVARSLEKVAGEALRDGEDIIPFEDGDLNSSGFVDSDPAALKATAAYSSPYAVKQHEDPTLHHSDGREDHWLEKTVNRNRQRYVDDIAAQVRARMGG